MQRREKGFTLIEILVVIAIIGVITSMVFPVFARAMEKSRQSICISNLRQLGMSMNMYANDWDGRLPTARVFEGGEYNPRGNWAGCYIYGGKCDPTMGQLYPYAKSVGIYKCPDAMPGKMQRIRSNAQPYPLSYSMNAMLSYIKLGNIAVPSRVGLLIHEDDSSIDDGDFNWMGWAGDPDEGHNEPSKVHNGGTCVLFCDLHARWQDYDTVMNALSSNDWSPKKP